MCINARIKNLILKTIFKVYKRTQINAIVLIGSRARGDYNKNSDYDIEVYLRRVKLKFDSKTPSLYEKNVFINYTDSRNFKELVRKGHSFLYCSFRDGIPLYQQKCWFDKNKKRVLKLKPKKETIAFYLESCLERLINLSKRRLFYLDYE
ncbi:MAG: nucleotidyltransferase domain-containing protein [Candidatus Pacearchaeota archaeon]|nr:nucleotidyltransferase domain-containing protein [Candidatus Pacearchaeota archaeon]